MSEDSKEGKLSTDAVDVCMYLVMVLCAGAVLFLAFDYFILGNYGMVLDLYSEVAQAELGWDSDDSNERIFLALFVLSVVLSSFCCWVFCGYLCWKINAQRREERLTSGAAAVLIILLPFITRIIIEVIYAIGGFIVAWEWGGLFVQFVPVFFFATIFELIREFWYRLTGKKRRW